MINRKKIGLKYTYDENWVGGAYYIQNLVIAFNKLEDFRKPLVVLFSEADQFEIFKNITGYPYLIHQSDYKPVFSIAERLLNKISRFLGGKNRAGQRKLLDLIFPAFYSNGSTTSKPVDLHWIPDFQEHYLPFFFSEEEIARRIAVQKAISSKKGALLLLSSRSAYNDYKKIYPGAVTENYIVPFAVSHPEYQNVNIEAVKRKYNIFSDYFLSANQFWAHKNHRVVIDAIKILKDQGINICVVFTGRQNDWRNPEYFTELEILVKENSLSENILFLGLIDRLEQLQLMKNAVAVLQPSRFEGWSTVIEDAKAMGQFVIASDIPVHIEQLKGNGILFKPDNPGELANIIRNVYHSRPQVIPINYCEEVKEYALNFLSILEKKGNVI